MVGDNYILSIEQLILVYEFDITWYIEMKRWAFIKYSSVSSLNVAIYIWK